MLCICAERAVNLCVTYGAISNVQVSLLSNLLVVRCRSIKKMLTYLSLILVIDFKLVVPCCAGLTGLTVAMISICEQENGSIRMGPMLEHMAMVQMILSIGTEAIVQ